MRLRTIALTVTAGTLLATVGRGPLRDLVDRLGRGTAVRTVRHAPSAR